jgi:hypothetical protein
MMDQAVDPIFAIKPDDVKKILASKPGHGEEEMSDEDRPVLSYATAENRNGANTLGTIVRLIVYIPVVLLGLYIILRYLVGLTTPAKPPIGVFVVGLAFMIAGGFLLLGTIFGWLRPPPR